MITDKLLCEKCKAFLNPANILFQLSIRSYLNWMPDSLYLKLVFRYYMHQKLHLKNPKTFNEKIQWIKLHDRKPIYHKLVDKFAVRDFIKNVIGEEYLIPLLGVWNSFDEIDFDVLPEQFVLKCNHDSKSVIICKDKASFDVVSARKKLNHFLKRDFYRGYRCWAYKDIPRKIIAEKYISSPNSESLTDYKIYCFNGKPKYIVVCTNRFDNLTITVFDTEWNLAPFHENHPTDPTIQKPNLLDAMLSKAETLAVASETKFVRVDLYLIESKIYFGELTLTPDAGLNIYDPPEWDYKLGELLRL